MKRNSGKHWYSEANIRHYSVGFEFRIFATIQSVPNIRTIWLVANFEYSPLFGRKRIFACVITIRKRSQVTEYRIFEIRWTALTWICVCKSTQHAQRMQIPQFESQRM